MILIWVIRTRTGKKLDKCHFFFKSQRLLRTEKSKNSYTFKSYYLILASRVLNIWVSGFRRNLGCARYAQSWVLFQNFHNSTQLCAAHAYGSSWSGRQRSTQHTTQLNGGVSTLWRPPLVLCWEENFPEMKGTKIGDYHNFFWLNIFVMDKNEKSSTVQLLLSAQLIALSDLWCPYLRKYP